LCDRRVISGIVQVLKSGCRWCDCPPEYGPPTTIYNRFVRWARRGVWENLFRELAGNGRSKNTQMIDSTHIKAHRSTAGGKRMARPSASGFFRWRKQSAQTYPALWLCRWPRWRSARSAPHKGAGIEVPFTTVGLRNADRLLGHLSLNHPQTLLTLTNFD
jgi:transposase